MYSNRVLHFKSSLGMIQGLKQLIKAGMKPRQCVFCALDPHGDVKIGVPERLRTWATSRWAKSSPLGPHGGAAFLPRLGAPHGRRRGGDQRRPPHRQASPAWWTWPRWSPGSSSRPRTRASSSAAPPTSRAAGGSAGSRPSRCTPRASWRSCWPSRACWPAGSWTTACTSCRPRRPR